MRLVSPLVPFHGVLKWSACVNFPGAEPKNLLPLRTTMRFLALHREILASRKGEVVRLCPPDLALDWGILACARTTPFRGWAGAQEPGRKWSY